jgi:hypothetical protein
VSSKFPGILIFAVAEGCHAAYEKREREIEGRRNDNGIKTNLSVYT